MKTFREFLLEKVTKSEKIEDIHFEEESTGYYSGQSNMILRAKDKKGQIMGYIEFFDYKGVPHVQFIKTSPDYFRIGVATKLLKELQRKYPDTEIELGYSTEEGTELLKSAELQRKFYPNAEYEKKKKEYEKLRKKYDQIFDIYEKWHKLFDTNSEEAEKQRSMVLSLGDEFQDLEHRKYDLELELEKLPKGKYLFM